MRLVYTSDGALVEPGDIVESRGVYVVSDPVGAPPHKPSSTGRIYVRPIEKVEDAVGDREYFPGVFGCKWVEK